MPPQAQLCTTVPAGASYYRVTSASFNTPNPHLHSTVVNGAGAVLNPQGGRYNYPGAVTVYLAEDVETCLAEKMFYFLREKLRGRAIRHARRGWRQRAD